jgi:hypothetical protein
LLDYWGDVYWILTETQAVRRARPAHIKPAVETGLA